MPLIKCPMCERDISPNAVACPHCGEPMKTQEVVSQPSDYKVILEGNLREKIKLIKKIRELTGLGLKEAKDLVDNVPSEVTICTAYSEAQKIVELLHRADGSADIKIVEVGKNNQNLSTITHRQTNTINKNKYISNASPIIKCPNCNSTDTHKISMTGRVTSALTFGIFSSSIGKTWKCSKCGYKW